MLTSIQTPAHVHYSGYTLSQLKPLIQAMYECCIDPHKHHDAVYQKYATAKYKHCSAYVAGKMATGITFSQLFAAATRPSNGPVDDTPKLGLPPAITSTVKPIPLQG